MDNESLGASLGIYQQTSQQRHNCKPHCSLSQRPNQGCRNPCQMQCRICGGQFFYCQDKDIKTRAVLYLDLQVFYLSHDMFHL